MLLLESEGDMEGDSEGDMEGDSEGVITPLKSYEKSGNKTQLLWTLT